MTVIPESRCGAIAYRVLDDGRDLTLYPMLPGQVRLCIGPAGADHFDAGWCYHDVAAAVCALATWNGVGDKPPGPWYRDLQTGERRKFGAHGSVVCEWVEW